jgi:hypothetical protein
MTLNEIKTGLKTLPRPEKFRLIRFLLAELENEAEHGQDEDVFQYFGSGEYAFWSQYNAFEAAQKLQMLLEADKK